MPKTKGLSKTVAKWKRVTPGRAEDYIEGVKNPRTDWAAATEAAESAYKEGVTKAATEGRFKKGVSKAGTQKWQAKTVAKGPNRWPEGISIAEEDYALGMKENLETIERVDLGPKFAKGDPRNYDRAKKIGMALHAMKTGK